MKIIERIERICGTMISLVYLTRSLRLRPHPLVSGNLRPKLPEVTDGEEIQSVAVTAEDTQVVVCPHCSKVLLRMALQIHHDESHAESKYAKR
jgi:hypothetical protein